ASPSPCPALTCGAHAKDGCLVVIRALARADDGAPPSDARVGRPTQGRTRKMAQPRKRPPHAHRTQSRTAAGTGAPLQDAAPYREFFENANDALALFNPDGTIALVNRAAERLLGYTRTELLGQHYRKVVTKATAALGAVR